MPRDKRSNATRRRRNSMKKTKSRTSHPRATKTTRRRRSPVKTRKRKHTLKGGFFSRTSCEDIFQKKRGLHWSEMKAMSQHKNYNNVGNRLKYSICKRLYPEYITGPDDSELERQVAESAQGYNVRRMSSQIKPPSLKTKAKKLMNALNVQNFFNGKSYKSALKTSKIGPLTNVDEEFRTKMAAVLTDRDTAYKTILTQFPGDDDKSDAQRTAHTAHADALAKNQINSLARLYPGRLG